jgi:FkbM family methyltransferase
MKLIRKIKIRYNQFKFHPVTKGNELKSLYEYILFNVKNRVFRELKYNWINNLKFIVRKGDAGIVGNIYFGLYEFEESIFLLHLIREEDMFLDVGANLGHYSLLLSGIKKCKSISIEPVPETFQQLLKQIKLNNLESFVEPINVGASNCDGELYFSTDRGTMDRIVDENYKNAVRVPVLSLDSIVLNREPIAIKIDVEGYEMHVLEGGSTILNNDKLKVLILELNQSGEKFGISDDEIYSKVLSLGFKPYSYNVTNRKLIQLQSYNQHKFNTIFVRDQEFVSNRLKNSSSIKVKNKNF